MYTLHIANKNYSSWSLRPWVLMKELAIPFSEVLTPFKANSNWVEFRNFSPSGTVPCLIDGEQVIWDSLAISEFLAEKHQGVWPDSELARTWARCASAEMHAGFFALRNECPMNCGVRVDPTAGSTALEKDLTRLDELWNQGLRTFKGPFLAGKQFTAVDAFYTPVAFRIRTFALKLSKPSMKYVNHLLGLDSVLDWEKGALAEAWREPSHEEDTLRAGPIVEDFRTVLEK